MVEKTKLFIILLVFDMGFREEEKIKDGRRNKQIG